MCHFELKYGRLKYPTVRDFCCWLLERRYQFTRLNPVFLKIYNWYVAMFGWIRSIFDGVKFTILEIIFIITNPNSNFISLITYMSQYTFSTCIYFRNIIKLFQKTIFYKSWLLKSALNFLSIFLQIKYWINSSEFVFMVCF